MSDVSGSCIGDKIVVLKKILKYPYLNINICTIKNFKFFYH